MTVDSSSAQFRSNWCLRVGVALAVLVVAGFYFWTVKTSSARLTVKGDQRDYYNLLVDGFQDGVLYMKVSPHPDLLALPPDKRPGPAPFLLDASLYQDRYYLYFGVVPAVLLYWPFATLTGHDLPEAWAVLILALAGFGFATACWLEVRRRWFPNLSTAMVVLGVLAIGFATAAPSMLRRPMFYEAAIGAGYASTMMAVWAILRAWTRPGHSWRWMAIAGVAVGLSIGSRANLAPAGASLLFLGAVGLAWQARPALKARAKALLFALFAAGVGSGVIGAGLAAYNYARFGDITEFGHHYQLGLNPQKMFRFSNLKHNVRLYYFAPPVLNGYFPFVAPADEKPKPPDYIGREHAHGEWVWMPLVVLGLGAGLWAASKSRAGDRGWLWITVLLITGFAINGGIVALTGVRANRYMIDFHPALVLATLVMLGAAVARSGWLVRIVRVAAGTGILLAVVFNALASMQVHGFFRGTDPEAYARVERRLDGLVWPFLTSERAAVGDRELEIRWPESFAGRAREPLVSTGAEQFQNVLWIEYIAPDRARFVSQHWETGDVVGEWFTLTPGKVSKVRISGGWLLPDVGHPWYGDRPMDEQIVLRRTLRVVIDGEVRLARDVPSFVSSPSLQRWGAWRYPSGNEFRFGGEIRRNEVTPVDNAWVRQIVRSGGLVRLRLELPRVMYGWAEPLVQMGSRDAFDIVAVRYLRPGAVQIVHDQSRSGARYSEEIPVNYDQPQFVEVELPVTDNGVRWVKGEPIEARQPPSRLRVRWNGQDVFDSDIPSHPATPASISIGYNSINASACRTVFSGPSLRSWRAEPIGRVMAGALELRGVESALLNFDRGLLLLLERDDQTPAGVLWRASSEGQVQLGWFDGGKASWSTPVPAAGLAGATLKLEISSAPSKGDDAQSPPWIEIVAGDKALLAERTAFFSAGAVHAQALGANGWGGPALLTGEHATPPAALAQPETLPGRMRIRFMLPPGGYAAGAGPLLSVGVPGAADSLFLRGVGDGRYVLGLDHWGIGSVESAPITLSPEDVHTLVVELGSLFGNKEVPPDTVRVMLEGKAILDTRVPLYPAKPTQVVIGANPHGMSTSGPTFRGEIISARGQQPPLEAR